MLVKEEKFDTPAYSAEHILDIDIHKKLIDGFTVKKDAQGLVNYLKYAAITDEKSNLARTYLVLDKSSGELACYFSLRTGLITIQIEGDNFDSLPAIELSNFATNETYCRKHQDVQSIGRYTFENFVLPISRCMSKYIGANSLYIYALPQERLIKHYKTMGFSLLPEDLEKFVQSHVKPKYDAGCRFMYQTL